MCRCVCLFVLLPLAVFWEAGATTPNPYVTNATTVVPTASTTPQDFWDADATTTKPYMMNTTTFQSVLNSEANDYPVQQFNATTVVPMASTTPQDFWDADATTTNPYVMNTIQSDLNIREAIDGSQFNATTVAPTASTPGVTQTMMAALSTTASPAPEVNLTMMDSQTPQPS